MSVLPIYSFPDYYSFPFHRTVNLKKKNVLVKRWKRKEENKNEIEGEQKQKKHEGVADLLLFAKHCTPSGVPWSTS